MAAPKSARGHRGRLRDKYLAQGLDAFTDAEVVELLLTLAEPRRDTKPMARAAVKRFGGLRGVLAADAKSLTEIDGLGPKNTLALQLVHDVARRFLRDRLIGRDFLNSPREAFDYLYHSLRDRRTEAVAVVYLDAQNGVIALEEPFTGTASVGPIEIAIALRRAMDLGAAGLVLAHNHPSGRAKPSPEDERTTRELVMAAAALGIKLVDHLIIGDNSYYSLAEVGFIHRAEDEFKTFLDR